MGDGQFGMGSRPEASRALMRMRMRPIPSRDIVIVVYWMFLCGGVGIVVYVAE
jgi:hypothetical protein